MVGVFLGLGGSVFAEPPKLTWVYMHGAEPACWNEDGVAKGVQVEIVEHVLGRLGI